MLLYLLRILTVFCEAFGGILRSCYEITVVFEDMCWSKNQKVEVEESHSFLNLRKDHLHLLFHVSGLIGGVELPMRAGDVVQVEPH